MTLNRNVARRISETDIDYFPEYQDAINQCNQTHKELYLANERIEELENEVEHQKHINRLVNVTARKRINTLCIERNKLREDNTDLKKLLMSEWRG